MELQGEVGNEVDIFTPQSESSKGVQNLSRNEGAGCGGQPQHSGQGGAGSVQYPNYSIDLRQGGNIAVPGWRMWILATTQ